MSGGHERYSRATVTGVAMRVRVARVAIALGGGALVAGISVVACGISTTGIGDFGADTGPSPTVDATPSVDGMIGNADGASFGDGQANDAQTSTDAPANDASDAGADGASITDASSPFNTDACTSGTAVAVPLASLRLAGNAKLNVPDNRIDLTAGSSQAGAAWSDFQVAPTASGTVTFDVVIPPSGSPGDGVAFALITDSALPSVGGGGDSFGLCNGSMSTAYGYGVVIDTFDNALDGQDQNPPSLKIVSIIAGVCLTVAADLQGSGASNIDDGVPRQLTVMWTPGTPGTLTATFVGAPALTGTASISLPASSLYVGFAGGTGSSNSTQAVTNISLSTTCP